MAGFMENLSNMKVYIEIPETCWGIAGKIETSALNGGFNGKMDCEIYQ